MNEIYFKCQFNDKDQMIVSKGEHICFEIFEGDGQSKTICLDAKQIYTLITICLDAKQIYTLIKGLENFTDTTIKSRYE